MMKMGWKMRDLLRFLMVLCASLIIAVNIKSFVRAGNLFPGGFTGLSLLIQRAADKYFNLTIPYMPINLLFNVGPIILSFRHLGKKFTLYSCVAIVMSSILTDILPVQVITYDLPLISVFGGLVNGAAISICLFANATSGGTDFIAVYFSDKKGIDAWNLILGANVIILAIAGALFGWDAALYSIIFQFVSTQVVHTVFRRYSQNTLLVITSEPDRVYEQIRCTTRHDATIFQGTGCYKKETRPMVYSVIAGDEVRLVIKKIREVDEKAFINVLRTDQLEGRFYHRPNE